MHLHRFEHSVGGHLLIQLRFHPLVGSDYVVAGHYLHCGHCDCTEHRGFILNCLISKNIIVSVGRPESLNEFGLGDITEVLGVKSRQEGFGLAVA